MSRNIYALLVGINDYSPNVGKLSGCLNDVDHFHGYLADNFDRGRLHIEVLKDADATRPNIIKQFRSHLGKANKDDVVVFQYCGHGARWKSAKPFEQFYPDGKDEGLVCYDSRVAGGFDLADKEFAALLAELARNEPHIAVILDCCHSGSATRSADDFTQGKCRQTHEVMEERPLESYLDGYYSGLLKRGESLEIPASRHILLAACQRKRLTLLVHSIGGLVSRWFIEREGGNKVVDHLVMFGTPNVGSPFGMVDSARQLSSLLTTLAINTFPVFAPFGGALVYLLNRSAKLTPTLEQMNPKSEFIKTLNTSPDPGIPYTIVAGDIRDFRESSDQFGAKLIAKLGTGIVFDTLYQKSGHDIAVSDDSITGVAADRTPAPNKSTVICHHLNYFNSEAGLKAITDLKW